MSRFLITTKLSQILHKMSDHRTRQSKNTSTLGNDSRMKNQMQNGGISMKFRSLSSIIIFLSSILLLTQACGGGGGGGGGGTPVTTYKYHAFYIGCGNQASCSDYRLYQLTEGETVATKIGDVDGIAAEYYGNTDTGTGNIVVLNNHVYYLGSKSGYGIFDFDPKLPEATNTNPKKINLSQGAYILTSIGNILYFVMDTPSTGSELFQFDTSQPESSTNPGIVRDLVAGPTGSAVDWLKAIDGKLYFSANVSNGQEPFVYDPTQPVSSTNPKEIFDIMGSGSGNSSFPREFVGLNGKIYFRAYRAAQGDELFIYDPAVAASSTNPLVVDIEPGMNSSLPATLTVAEGKLYFRARTASASNHYQLYALDPQASLSSTNPQVVYDLLGPSGNEAVNRLSRLGKYVYFEALDALGSSELFFFDTSSPASASNPAQVTDLFPGSTFQPRYHRAFGKTLLVNGINDSSHQLLYTISESDPQTLVQIPESNPTGLGDVVYDLVEWAEAQ